MTNILPLNPSPEDLARHINRLAEGTHKVIFTKHARERMTERRITSRHVIACLRKGRVIEGPYQGMKGDWRCTMIRVVSGTDVTVAVAVNFKDDVIVVTVY